MGVGRVVVMLALDCGMALESEIDVCEMTYGRLDPGRHDACVGGDLRRPRSLTVLGGIDDDDRGLVELDRAPKDCARIDAGNLLCESFDVRHLVAASLGGDL